LLGLGVGLRRSFQVTERQPGGRLRVGFPYAADAEFCRHLSRSRLLFGRLPLRVRYMA
jgi:hypothetical protein